MTVKIEDLRGLVEGAQRLDQTLIHLSVSRREAPLTTERLRLAVDVDGMTVMGPQSAEGHRTYKGETSREWTGFWLVEDLAAWLEKSAGSE